MTSNQINNNQRDLWLESQKDAIRALKPDHKVDVTEAVMQRVASMPTPKAAPAIGIRRNVVKWVAAACVGGIAFTAGMAVTSTLLFRPDAPATTASVDIASHLIDVYDYCNDYADPDAEDEASFYDNPVTYFL